MADIKINRTIRVPITKNCNLVLKEYLNKPICLRPVEAKYSTTARNEKSKKSIEKVAVCSAYDRTGLLTTKTSELFNRSL